MYTLSREPKLYDPKNLDFVFNHAELYFDPHRSFMEGRKNRKKKEKTSSLTLFVIMDLYGGPARI